MSDGTSFPLERASVFCIKASPIENIDLSAAVGAGEGPFPTECIGASKINATKSYGRRQACRRFG